MVLLSGSREEASGAARCRVGKLYGRGKALETRTKVLSPGARSYERIGRLLSGTWTKKRLKARYAGWRATWLGTRSPKSRPVRRAGSARSCGVCGLFSMPSRHWLSGFHCQRGIGAVSMRRLQVEYEQQPLLPALGIEDTVSDVTRWCPR